MMKSLPSQAMVGFTSFPGEEIAVVGDDALEAVEKHI
jgi:hypothetical protein